MEYINKFYGKDANRYDGQEAMHSRVLNDSIVSNNSTPPIRMTEEQHNINYVDKLTEPQLHQMLKVYKFQKETNSFQYQSDQILLIPVSS